MPQAYTAMFWHLMTRLGEVQILLPAALLASLVLVARRDSWPTFVMWLSLLAFMTSAPRSARIR